MPSQELQELADLIEAATEELNEASKAAANAQNTEINARNKLNDLQKEFDKQVQSIRDAASRGTHWDNVEKERKKNKP